MTSGRKIGVLTIGQAPRADDTVAELLQVLGPGYTITERGALERREEPRSERSLRSRSQGPPGFEMLALYDNHECRSYLHPSAARRRVTSFLLRSRHDRHH